eukprot:CAMPEP_0174275714 /NCGR_PEP_ID=MMETSP0439-20130205/59976_1 /TAXON_ID=0 /ORGANISM="Stereomyxa ramosa, Strain Chinc5" /LENGTH=400 /DNA_ID=CAMNT_0015367847 /DNA_START=589 /DNA_END=1791 /DNA_ORIENTATION=+
MVSKEIDFPAQYITIYQGDLDVGDEINRTLEYYLLEQEKWFVRTPFTINVKEGDKESTVFIEDMGISGGQLFTKCQEIGFNTEFKTFFYKDTELCHSENDDRQYNKILIEHDIPPGALLTIGTREGTFCVEVNIENCWKDPDAEGDVGSVIELWFNNDVCPQSTVKGTKRRISMITGAPVLGHQLLLGDEELTDETTISELTDSLGFGEGDTLTYQIKDSDFLLLSAQLPRRSQKEFYHVDINNNLHQELGFIYYDVFHEGKLLDATAEIKELGLEQGANLVLQPDTNVRLCLFIRTLTGKTVTLDGVGLLETVLDLKNRVYSKEGLPPNSQRLIFAGRQLSDEVLGRYGIHDGSTLHLTIRIRGGGGCEMTTFVDMSGGDHMRILLQIHKQQKLQKSHA